MTHDSPVDLGAPAKFASWREGQFAAVQKALESDKRFVALSLATGAGKTLIYMIAAMQQGLGRRAVILTSTKSLQDQLARDFGNSLVDIRGMNNYECAPLNYGGEFYERTDNDWDRACDKGPCKTGFSCSLRESGCPYFDRVRQAAASSIVSTNYAYWLAGGKSLGHIDLLVLDEAHKAPEELAGFLSLVNNLVDSHNPRSQFFRRGAEVESNGWDVDEWPARHIKYGIAFIKVQLVRCNP